MIRQTHKSPNVVQLIGSVLTSASDKDATDFDSIAKSLGPVTRKRLLRTGKGDRHSAVAKRARKTASKRKSVAAAAHHRRRSKKKARGMK